VEGAMLVGTKSVLFGAHCFIVHPWFVALAWWRLYGFPWDVRLWVAFFVHDLGYLGKPNMDGTEGEQHPTFGAKIMLSLFGREWHDFTLLHSRYFAKRLGKQPSRLCIADKLAIVLTPAWLYLPMVRLTGEVKEYMAHSKHRIVGNERVSEEEKQQLLSGAEKDWYAGVQQYLGRWVEAHRDGAADTWTSDARKRAVLNNHGVWQ
jgi:hypothetical protein